MIGGPVCHFELVRIARNRLMFVGRFVVGLFLFLLIAASYSNQSGPGRPWYDPGELTIAEMSRLGPFVFFSVMGTLAALVIGLTPALVADALAAERQGKTLHFVLGTRLSSLEIVLGKLVARLLNVGTFAALMLPIMSLLTLLGGVSPAALVLGYAALAASAYFIAALALLVSVLSRRPREAIGTAYTLTAFWLFLPVLLQALEAVARPPFLGLLHGALWLGQWVGPTTPLELITNAQGILGSGADELWRNVAWMAVTQSAYGTLFVFLAAWQLRPAFRRHEGRSARPVAAARLARRWFPVRPCTDDPVFWKEAYFAVQAGGIARRLVRVGVFLLLGVILLGALYGSADAFRELREHGYGYGDSTSYGDRFGLSLALRAGSGALFVVWMLSLGGITAAGISSEREQDTWISLLSTPLEAREILRGKMLGPLRATGHFGITIVALWVIGVAAGALHPLGFLNALVVAAICTAFVIAQGTYSSFKSRSTWRARLWTQGVVLVPHTCCFPYLPAAGPLVGVSLWSYAEIHALGRADLAHLLKHFGEAAVVLVWYFGGLAFHGLVAFARVRALHAEFERSAGRPKQGPRLEVVLEEWKVVADDTGYDPTT